MMTKRMENIIGMYMDDILKDGVVFSLVDMQTIKIYSGEYEGVILKSSEPMLGFEDCDCDDAYIGVKIDDAYIEVSSEEEIREFYNENKEYLCDIAQASPYWRELNDDDFSFLARKCDNLAGKFDLQGDIIYLMQNLPRNSFL